MTEPSDVMIELLLIEHYNIAKLLDILEHEIDIFAQAKQPDYDIIKGIADYFLDYPDACHHPKEDLIFERLRVRDSEAARSIGDLAKEHEKTAARVRRFANLVEDILNETILSREEVVEAARAFISAERRHMQMEEERFFPAAAKALTAKDWREIMTRYSDLEDPLVDRNEKIRLEALRKKLMQWAQEARN